MLQKRVKGEGRGGEVEARVGIGSRESHPQTFLEWEWELNLSYIPLNTLGQNTAVIIPSAKTVVPTHTNTDTQLKSVLDAFSGSSYRAETAKYKVRLV